MVVVLKCLFTKHLFCAFYFLALLKSSGVGVATKFISVLDVSLVPSSLGCRHWFIRDLVHLLRPSHQIQRLNSLDVVASYRQDPRFWSRPRRVLAALRSFRDPRSFVDPVHHLRVGRAGGLAK